MDNISDAIKVLALEVLAGGKVYNNINKTCGCLVPSYYAKTPKEHHDTIINKFSTKGMVVGHYLRYIKGQNVIVELFSNTDGFGAIGKLDYFKGFSVSLDGKEVKEI